MRRKDARWRKTVARLPEKYQAIAWPTRNTGSAKPYQRSARVPPIHFAVTTKCDRSQRAPEAVLRLGQSLAAMGEKETACAAWGEIGRKYTSASANVKKNVAAEQKRVRC